MPQPYLTAAQTLFRMYTFYVSQTWNLCQNQSHHRSTKNQPTQFKTAEAERNVSASTRKTFHHLPPRGGAHQKHTVGIELSFDDEPRANLGFVTGWRHRRGLFPTFKTTGMQNQIFPFTFAAQKL